MNVRDGEHAVVDILKLQLYCLDLHHPRGCYKARQFDARLGIGTQDAEMLQEQLLEAMKSSENAVVGERDEYGQRYQLDVEVKGPKGKATVRTYWIKRTRDLAPRLTTCFVLK